MKIAMLQILPGKSIDENIKKGVDVCRKASDMDADIALFPEMWSSGYFIAAEMANLKRDAVAVDSEYIETFSRLAKELDMAIGITFLEKHEPSPRNSLVLIDRHGDNVLTYAKVHTCDFGPEHLLTAGDDFYVANLDTRSGIVKVGAMICYDREFPESARILMLEGAEIILVPNACPMEINRLDQLRCRAFENMLGVATCNYPKGQPDCNGCSSAFDGIAWKQDGSESRDMCILNAGGEEGIYTADFNLDEIREYRKKEIFGNSYRHPSKYTLLTTNMIQPPFIRADYRE